MNLHSSSHKTDCRNEYSHIDFGKLVSLTFTKASSMFARNTSQGTFHSVENQRNTMKTTVFFHLNEFPLKLT